MTNEDIAEQMAHPGAVMSTQRIVAGLRAASSQTFTDEAREAIDAAVAKVTAISVHVGQWIANYDRVAALYSYEHEYRKTVQATCASLEARVHELEGLE